MSFVQRDESGKQIRNRVMLDCTGDKIWVEQNHKAESDINNIVNKYGIDKIAATAALQQAEYTFDDLPGNDFQEAMIKVTKAQTTFDALPSSVRKQFSNNPAEFLDFVQNPENKEKMVEMGLAKRIPPTQPIQVEVIPQQQTAETPPSEGAA